VIHRVDDRLRDEARRFNLVFTCDACASFDEGARACSLGYPNEMHLDADLDARREVIFCKAFELA
jgi:hypothetical protein